MSSTKISIRFFNDREVRALWDEAHAKWWFSVLDVVAVLTDQDDYAKARNYWKYPPMAGQMEMTDILVRTYENNIQRSIGGIGINGIMQTLDDYGSGGVDVMDTWVLFGDPTAYMRTANPATLTINHTATTPLVTQQITFTSATPDAFVALTVNDEIIGTGYMVNGTVTISIDPLTTLNPILVTGTAFNHTSYLGEIEVVSMQGPFVSNTLHAVNDQQANNNQMLDYNESSLLNVSLANIGLATAYGVEATISTSSPYVSITDNYHFIGDIMQGADLLQVGAYAVQVAAYVPDQSVAVFVLAINDADGNTWSESFSLVINAPVLACGSLLIEDSNGNNNGRFDSGESITVQIEVTNTGHAAASQVEAILSNLAPYLFTSDPNATLLVLNTGETLTVQFNLTVADQIPAGSSVNFGFDASSGPYATDCSFNEAFNMVVEDWESNTMNAHDWTSVGTSPWFTTNEQPFEGLYCSQSGAIADNMSSILEIFIDSILPGQSISFARKVSSEADWDFLRFYIDGTLSGEWSGEVAWGTESYPLTGSAHTFSWEYFKDPECCTGGADAAWVDEIILPQTEQAPVMTTTSEEGPMTLLSVFPNPNNGQAVVHFFLPAAGSVHMELFDSNGRSVQVLNNGPMASGPHSIYTGPNLAAGVYSLEMTTASSVEQARIVVLH